MNFSKQLLSRSLVQGYINPGRQFAECGGA
jgi:hypothetical protein